jgi:hypothetical protein
MGERAADAGRGWTPRELARVLRVSPERIRDWIRRGELSAVSTATRTGRPRLLILPQHLRAWERRHRVQPTPKPAPRRRRAAEQKDYFPDL